MNQALNALLDKFRRDAKTEREKGTYFEELIKTYLRHEASYKDLYSQVWSFGEWAKEQGVDAKDTGIDLVAKTHGTNEYHAIQCKFYDDDYRVQKKDIDSFFTASGKKPFTHRVIVTTTNNWSENAEDALQGQTPPVTKIDYHDLANSQIEWSKYAPKKDPVLKKKKDIRRHQEKALAGVESGLAAADRGKLIMACGTGKTFTALKIAEKVAGKGKRILFLVPSLSLLSQTLTEWTQESAIPLHSFAVCSDSDIGKKRKADEDVVQTYMHELRYPSTTDAGSLAEEMAKRHDKAHMSVVFSTYHSIDVISEAQKEHGLEDFDLIICDEAHRTTGATYAEEKEKDEESNFVRVHNNDFIRGKKRLYMTATPRIYGDVAEAKAEKEGTILYSMNKEEWYGKELHVLTFSEAVIHGLLVDYKVIVLTVDEAHISSRLQKLLADENNQLKVDDAAKIVGCWKALSKQYQEDATDDKDPMRRTVAFCQVIEAQKGARVHKVSSKNIAAMFQSVVEAYQEQDEDHNTLICEAAHIDGSMNATAKEEKLEWLKAELPEDTCRILSNVRCLSEGVDVPALDAVLFLTPRNSQVDVVQSVGRIMRNTPDMKKKRGYVILPVVIPTGVEPHEALNDNKTYKVVWDVLQALRSHDDRFDAMINKFDLVGKDHSKMEVIAITDKIRPKQKQKIDKKDAAKGSFTIGEPVKKASIEDQLKLQFQIGEIERALYAKMVEKCGNRQHWEDLAKNIAEIARKHTERIRVIVNDPNNKREIKAFNDFVDELRDDLNDQITNDEVIEMLSQHLITKPVFDALFEKYSFARHNSVSQAMQSILETLQEHRLEKETDELEKFYTRVKIRAGGIENSTAKQKIIAELYDKFFKNAFPKLSKKLGIVYTPVEAVDFVINSVNDVLEQEFGETLGSKEVHILDPFTGTGTFITRLLQSGLIKRDEIEHKYRNEIHANEIVLLAYYIAAINIEAAYHEITGGDYEPFKGICLTDTFQLSEKDDLVSKLLVDNSSRRTKQKNLDIRVIVGNPPYSEGQDDGNDDAQNIEYPTLNESIRTTYGAQSTAGLQNSLFNDYIRAYRWASNRVGNRGIVAFVSGAGWISGNSFDGMRKCLAKEFSSIYIFNLRGNARTKGELRRKEKDNIFAEGSRSQITISILCKNPSHKGDAKIYYRDIGDYLGRQEKLSILQMYGSVNGISKDNGWTIITPNEFGDWLKQRDSSFNDFISIADKDDEGIPSIFGISSSGIKTNRDPWCYNASKKIVAENMERMIAFYNAEMKEYKKKYPNKKDSPEPEKVVNKDSKKIKWTREIFNSVRAGREGKFDTSHVVQSVYRPFSKEWAYFDRHFNNCIYQMPKVFPYKQPEKNLAIVITGPGAQSFSCLITDCLPNYDMQSKGLALPLKIFASAEAEADADDEMSDGLFKGQNTLKDSKIRDGITEVGSAHFNLAYPSENIAKEDIFYYVYGILHSEDYREKYGDNLSKQLPRIPCVKSASDFWAFSKAGRELASLHLSFEKVKPYDVTIDAGTRKLAAFSEKEYRVVKMKFPKKEDKSTVIYNDFITIKDIPVEAYEYEINGKPALEWVMERQGVKLDKESGITNDANLYAVETADDPSYPLKLFQRIITVSLETLKIVRNLPRLDVQVPAKEKAA